MPRTALLALTAALFAVAAAADASKAPAETPEPKELVQMELTLTKNRGGKQIREVWPRDASPCLITLTRAVASQPLQTNVFDNEDAAAAAVRVCYESDNLDHELAHQIKDHLQKKLDEGGHKPEPEGVEKLRTAGAYTRRAKVSHSCD